ncbi:hypothetical protein Tco_0300953 [Tanacetum coccineum]
MSHHYTMDENAYPRFLHDNREGGFLSLYIVHLVVFDYFFVYAEMDLFAFIHVVDPTKLKIVERERIEGERKLLDFTVGHVVPLLPVSPARSEGDLEASVDRLFDEGSSTDQGDSAIGSGHNAVIEPVTDVKDIAAEIGGHKTSSKVDTGGKSLSVIKELLTSSILNVEVGVEAVATLPLITFSVSATPEHEGGDLTDYVTGPNLHTIGSSEKFVISSDSSHRSSTNAAKVEVDSFIRSAAPLSVMTEAVVTNSIASAPSIPVPEAAAKITPPVQHSNFHDSSSANKARQINIGTARQACLNAKVRMRTEYCLNERMRLGFECERQADLLKVSVVEAAKKVHADELDALKQKSVAFKDEKDSLNGKITELLSLVSAKDFELKDFNVTVSSLKSQNDDLVDQVHALETTCSSLHDQVSRYERLKEQIEEFQDARMNIINDKVAKLDVDLVEMDLYLEEKLYPHLLTTIFGRRWLLTCGIKLAVVKCLNSPEYLMDLGAAISRAIENGILCEVDFHLLAELSSHKDASVEYIMNLLRLESSHTDAPRISDLQPDVEQLMLSIHRFEDQVVLGETSLSFALSVSHSRVKKIKENITAQRSAFIDVWVPLVEPLSAENLMGAAGTSDSVPATVTTTTSLSTTFASTSFVPPITIDDYETVGADYQEDAQGNVQGNVYGNVASFPTVEFEKEELDTTP